MSTLPKRSPPAGLDAASPETAVSYAPSAILPGQVLAGKYRVERMLGVGGMGMVFAAYHLQLDEMVALKLMLPDVLANPEAVARFSAEARAVAKIKSEHVARVSDVGSLESGEPYIVMEHLEGEDLSSWLKNRGLLSVEQAAEFVIQACDALVEAHALGIVHRDLKPDNLFCIRRTDGSLAIKVLDFGICKIAPISRTAPDITTPWAVMGSPHYMSPEQLESATKVDARGDIWALGVILYELISGKQPFSAESMSAVILKIASQAPEPLDGARLALPPGLETVILRCLDKDRESRYQDVGELALSLGQFAGPRSTRTVERIQRVVHATKLSPAASASNEEPGTMVTRVTPHGDRHESWSPVSTSSRPAPPRKRTALLGSLAVAALLLGWFGVHTVLGGSALPAGPAAAVAVAPLAPVSKPVERPLRVVSAAPSAPAASDPALGTTTKSSVTGTVSPPKAARVAPRPNVGLLIEDRQ